MVEFILGVSLVCIFLVTIKLAINTTFSTDEIEYEEDYGKWR